jgi:hypothetical protein
MLLCRTGLMRCKAGKTSGPVLLPPVVAQYPASGKITNARAAARPILFYHLSPEAARLTILARRQEYSCFKHLYVISNVSRMLVLCKASAKKLRVRAGKTGGLRDGRGIAIFAEAWASGCEAAQNFAARGFS